MIAVEVADLLSTRVALSFAAVGQSPEGAREELRALIGRAAAHRVARIALSGSLVVVRSGIIEKYIPLTRFIVLVRPAAYLLVAPGETVKKDAGYSPLQEHYVQKILSGIASRVPSLPSSLLNLGLRSSIAFTSGGTVEATACRGAIMALRGRALTPALVVDRGADSPDKSWFDVQRRNARWHGLDARMLDELYTIAAENDW